MGPDPIAEDRDETRPRPRLQSAKASSSELAFRHLALAPMTDREDGGFQGSPKVTNNG